MKQDLRALMQKRKTESSKLPNGHEERFANKLEAHFGEKNNTKQHTFYWLKIASVAVVFMAIGMFTFYSIAPNKSTIDGNEIVSETAVQTVSNKMTLGDISPDLKKVEDYYMAGINVQLASLQINNDNKDLIDGYMEQLDELDNEYAVLNDELNTIGPTEATITALIDNLKLRLELLFKLKNKLKELKNQNNEQINSIQI